MRLIALVLSLFSFSVIACPNLTGNYTTCRSTTGGTEGSRDIVVTQKVVNNIHHYSMSYTDEETQERVTENYIADGKMRTETQSDPESGLSLTQQKTVSCKGAELNVTMKVSINGESAANLKMKITKSGDTMTQVGTGDQFGSPVNETVICK